MPMICRLEERRRQSGAKAIISQEVVRALVNANGPMTQAIEIAVRAQEMGKVFLSSRGDG
jgi:hypothetical protein